MKKMSFAAILTAILLLFSCSSGGPGEGVTIAKINDYHLTVDDFKRQLAYEVQVSEDFKVDKAVGKEFLDQIISKELLIQEAKKLDLDQKERFLLSIARYWESALIRSLMEIKTEEISKNIIVSQEEIKAHYQNLVKESVLPPLQDMEPILREELTERKKTEVIEAWVNGLRKSANVEINEELLLKSL